MDALLAVMLVVLAMFRSGSAYRAESVGNAAFAPSG